MMALVTVGSGMGTVEEVSENLFFPDNEVLLPGMYDTLSVMTSTENYTLSIANRLFVPEGVCCNRA